MKVLMLTVLNPAFHSRIFFKECLTLAQAGFQMYLAAPYPFERPFHREKVVIIPVTPFHRLSLRRIIIGFYYLFLAFRIRPDIIHIHTPELLWVGWLLLKILRVKLIYDMHEDYAQNILYYQGWPWVLRPVLAALVRKIELATAPDLTGVIYAESCFDNILSVTAEKRVVIRNLHLSPPGFKPKVVISNQILTLAVAGTLAKSWGTEQAIKVWQAINLTKGPCKLVLAGFCAGARQRVRIRQLIAQSGFAALAELHGIYTYLPHEKLIELISTADAILALYEISPANAQRIPTRFYEAMAVRRPLFFTNNAVWLALNAQLRFGYGVAYDNISRTADQIWQLYQQQWPGYPNDDFPAEAWDWTFEGKRLVNWYSKYLKTD
jgi:glycosyltransferase involved in cell wall biosynthesis